MYQCINKKKKHMWMVDHLRSRLDETTSCARIVLRDEDPEHIRKSTEEICRKGEIC